MKPDKQLNGSWEERGVIGDRIEISDNRIVFLWMSGPVLQTTFTIKEENGVKELQLARKGLRYQNASSDYGTVERVYFEDGKLHYVKHFPISGLSESVLTPTERSRYGNVTIDDTLLKKVQGTWQEASSGYFSFEIHKDRLKMQKEIYPIHGAVKPATRHGEEFSLIHQDPSRHRLACFEEMVYADGVIKAYMLVCDLGMQEMIFHKKA